MTPRITKITALLIWFAFLGAIPIEAAPGSSQFTKVQLAPGLAIEIPSHWSVLSSSDSANLATMSEAIRKNSGTPEPDYQKTRLLAVSSIPAPTGAQIRVNVISPNYLTQEMLSNATSAELAAVRDEMYKSFKALESLGGTVIVSMEQARVEEISKLKALVLSYKRQSTGAGPSLWQVTQYGIPTSGKTIQITLSYRLVDGALWKPILDRVKQSVTIE